MAAARELTKLHEEIFRGSISAARQHYSKNEPRGEFTLVIAGRPQEEGAWSDGEVRQALLHAQRPDDPLFGKPASSIARILAARAGWPKSRVYDFLKELANNDE
jgi:16S rRNA (cytidine1402-2'-O)-methyltransferase